MHWPTWKLISLKIHLCKSYKTDDLSVWSSCSSQLPTVYIFLTNNLPIQQRILLFLYCTGKWLHSASYVLIINEDIIQYSLCAIEGIFLRYHILKELLMFSISDCPILATKSSDYWQHMHIYITVLKKLSCSVPDVLTEGDQATSGNVQSNFSSSPAF